MSADDRLDEYEGGGVRGRVNDLAQRARDSYDSFRDSSRDLSDRARRHVDDARLYVGEHASEHPLTLAAGALAVGVAIGLLVGLTAARR